MQPLCINSRQIPIDPPENLRPVAFSSSLFFFELDVVDDCVDDGVVVRATRSIVDRKFAGSDPALGTGVSIGVSSTKRSAANPSGTPHPATATCSRFGSALSPEGDPGGGAPDRDATEDDRH
jgi:hypothetical protein